MHSSTFKMSYNTITFEDWEFTIYKMICAKFYKQMKTIQSTNSGVIFYPASQNKIMSNLSRV